LGFTTFFTSRRRSRYSVFSRKLSLSLSITENFQSRTCRSESWGVDCASSPADHKTRVERLEVDTLERHELFLNVSDEGVTKRFRTESITKYTLTTINTRWGATRRVMAAKLTRLTHKIAIQLHLVAESCATCSSRSRRPVRKLLDTPSYYNMFQFCGHHPSSLFC
jgi:hypothetical protein